MSKKKGLGKLFAGLAIGAGLGMLFAPKKGSDTRKELKEKLDDMLEKAKKLTFEDVRDGVEAKIFNIKNELDSLDKEKVLKSAKEKANKVKDMTQELVDYVSEKGTPVLEKAASSIKTKATEVTKDVLAKLEAGDKKSE